MPLIDTHAQVETPESVEMSFQVAGPGCRLGAYAMDLMFRVIAVFVLFFLATMIASLLEMADSSSGMVMGVVLVVMFLLEWAYGAFFEGLWNGQTPGKKVYRLRVVRTGGYPIGFYEATIRNLVRTADMLPFGYAVGLLSMISTKRFQRLGDLVADTMVVVESRNRFSRDRKLLDHVPALPRVACTRTFHVSERTLDVIEQLFARASTLTRTRTEEIARSLAKPMAMYLGYAPELDDAQLDAADGVNREELPATYFLQRVLRTFASVDETPGRRRAWTVRQPDPGHVEIT